MENIDQNSLELFLKSAYIANNDFDGSVQEMYTELAEKVCCGDFMYVDYEALEKQYPFYARHMYNNGLYHRKKGRIVVKTFYLGKRGEHCVKGWLSNIGKKPVPLEGAISLCRACGLSFEQTMAAVKIMCDEDCSGRNIRKVLLRHAAKGCIPFEEIAIRKEQLEQALEQNMPIGRYADFYNRIAEFGAASSSEGISDTETVIRSVDDANSYEELVGIFMNDPKQTNSLLAESTQLVEFITAAIKNLAGENSTEREYLVKKGAFNLYPQYTQFCRGEATPSPEWFLKLAVQLRLEADDVDIIRHRLAISNDTVHAPLWEAARESLSILSDDGDIDGFYLRLDNVLKEYGINRDYEKSLLLYQFHTLMTEEPSINKNLCFYVGEFLLKRVMRPVIKLQSDFLGMNIPRLLYTFGKDKKITAESNYLTVLLGYLLDESSDDFSQTFMKSYLPESKGVCEPEYSASYWFRGFVYTVMSGRIYRPGASICDLVSDGHPMIETLQRIQNLPDSDDIAVEMKKIIEDLR